MEETKRGTAAGPCPSPGSWNYDSHSRSPPSEASGARFWFHGMRNCFITAAERELMLPHGLHHERLVNHAPPNDVSEGYEATDDRTARRSPLQRIADRRGTRWLGRQAFSRGVGRP